MPGEDEKENGQIIRILKGIDEKMIKPLGR